MRYDSDKKNLNLHNFFNIIDIKNLGLPKIIFFKSSLKLMTLYYMKISLSRLYQKRKLSIIK